MMALTGQCGFSHDNDITDRLKGKDWGGRSSDGVGGWERPTGSVSFLGTPVSPPSMLSSLGQAPQHVAQQHLNP